MKKLLSLFAMAFALVNAFAQTTNVGIGTNNPQTKLEVSGAISSTPASAAASASVQIPDNVSIFRLTLVAGGGTSALTLSSPKEGQYLTIYNEDDNAATFAGQTIAATTGVMAFDYINGAWRMVSDNQVGTTNNYIKNQTASDQAAGFRINGNGLFNGGQVTMGTANPANASTLVTVNTSSTYTTGIGMTLSGGSGTGINISSGSSNYNNINATNSGSASATYYAVGGQLTSGVLSGAGTFASGYLGYHTGTGNTAANYYAGYLKGKTAITSDNSPTSVSDLEVQNTTNGTTPVTFSMRPTSEVNTSGTNIAQMNFGDSRNTSAQAQIQAVRDVTGTSGSGSTDLPTALTFSTTPDGSATMAERMRISNAGNVGVGDNNPSDKLTVSGKTKTTNLQMTNGATNGFVMQSDASGNASWVSLSSVGGVTSVTASPPLNSTGGSTPNISLSGTVPVANGGTGLTAVGAGQVLIGTSAGGFLNANITGTANQVNVASASGSVTLSAPQDIATTSNVQFNTTTLNTATDINSLTAGRSIKVGATAQAAAGAGGGAIRYNTPNVEYSDGSTWKVLSTGGTVTGSGTLNFVPKFTPNGTTLGNSQIFDNGTSVGIGTSLPGFPLHVVNNTTGTWQQARFSNTADYIAGISLTRSGGAAGGDWIMYRYGSGGSDHFSIGLNGVNEPFSILTNGNVGIGTSSPDGLLHVNGQLLVYPKTGVNDFSSFMFSNNQNATVRLHHISGVSRFYTDASTQSISLATNGETDRLFIMGTGNIGIGGFTSPASRLAILQGTNSTDGGLRTYNTSQAQWTALYTGGDNGSYLQNTNGYLMINSSGNVGVGTTLPTANLHVIGSGFFGDGVSAPAANTLNVRRTNANSVSWLSLVRDGAVTHLVSTGGAGRTTDMVFSNDAGGSYIFNTGNVGVGTTAPGAKLEVAGQIKITGGSPAANRVLTSDASGLATWTDPASVPGNVTGTGTQNFVTKWNNAGGTTIGNSQIFDNGTNVGIGTNSPDGFLHITGSALHYPKPGIADFSSLVLSNNLDATIRVRHFGGISRFYTDAASQSISLATNGQTDRLFISGGGNIGIGPNNTGPSFLVHIKQVDAFNSLVVEPTTATNAAGIQIKNGSNTSYFFVDNSTGTYSGLGAPGANNTNIWGGSNVNMNFATNNTVRMTIANTGSVGIGLTGPSEKLEISGGNLLLDYTTGSTGLMLQGTGGTHNITLWNDNTNVIHLVNQNTTLKLGEGGLDRVTITGGNVGIGTTIPNQKLEVVGTTRISTLAGSGTRLVQTNNTGDLALSSFDPSAVFTGSGTANFVARWTTGTNLTAGILYDNGTSAGIGTTSPTEKLEISGGNLMLNYTTGLTGLLIQGTGGGHNLTLWNDNANIVHLVNQNATLRLGESGTDRITMTGGNVGIGTTSPIAALNVQGTGTGSYRGIQVQNTFTDATSKGGLSLIGARYTNANVPFTAFGTWDDNTNRQLYMGGGGWGTTDATLITFWTAAAYNETISAGVERMRINAAGNVGVGITTPNNLLHVDVNSASAGTDAISVANRGVSALGHTAGLRFQYNTAVPAAVRARLTNVGNGAGDLGLFTSSDGTAANLAERLTVTSAGKVGIGTTTPTKVLEVLATDGEAARLYRNASTPQFGVNIRFALNNAAGTEVDYAGVHGQINTNTTNAEGGNLLFTTATSGALTEKVRIDNNGFVGVGNNAPAVLMDLKGNNVSYGGQLRLAATDYDQITFYNSGNLALNATNRLADMYYDIAGSVLNIENQTGNKYLLLNQGGGNVGIGTTAPGAKLTVSGTTSGYGSGAEINNHITRSGSHTATGGAITVLHLPGAIGTLRIVARIPAGTQYTTEDYRVVNGGWNYPSQVSLTNLSSTTRGGGVPGYAVAMADGGGGSLNITITASSGSLIYWSFDGLTENVAVTEQ